jgi:hypothetical protein
MVDRDGARDTNEALTSDGGAVPSAVHLSTRPPATPFALPDGLLGAVGSLFAVAAADMKPALSSPRPVNSGRT